MCIGAQEWIILPDTPAILYIRMIGIYGASVNFGNTTLFCDDIGENNYFLYSLMGKFLVCTNW